MTRTFLRGEVSPGGFPNERVLVFSDHQGHRYTVIVTEDEVDGDKVRVRELRQQDDLTLVRLPGETIGCGSIVTVRDSQLTRSA